MSYYLQSDRVVFFISNHLDLKFEKSSPKSSNEHLKVSFLFSVNCCNNLCFFWHYHIHVLVFQMFIERRAVRLFLDDKNKRTVQVTNAPVKRQVFFVLFFLVPSTRTFLSHFYPVFLLGYKLPCANLYSANNTCNDFPFPLSFFQVLIKIHSSYTYLPYYFFMDKSHLRNHVNETEMHYRIQCATQAGNVVASRLPVHNCARHHYEAFTWTIDCSID